MGHRLQDKTALVTGATSNIGRAIAIAFAAQRASVVVSGRSAARGAEVVGEIEASGVGRGRFVPAQLDGSASASRQLAEAAGDAFNRPIDVLVNNAGIFPAATTTTADEAMFDEDYAVNVKAPFS
jgi:NAD(P)-dependent dehydrogenase (short-subunit alcohol dehydrogenase family)